MKQRFGVGDRVVIMGHEDGPMKPGEHSRNKHNYFSCYIPEMDKYIGCEAVVAEVFVDDWSGRVRYYLDDATTEEPISCYWIDEWISPAKGLPDVGFEMEELL